VLLSDIIKARIDWLKGGYNHMVNALEILSPKLDLIFKLLFGTEGSIEILTDFLLSVLKLSPSEYDKLTIANPFLLQEYKGGKLGILDVKLTLKSGKVINIEIQVDPAPAMTSRIVFYTSKLVTSQMSEGDSYDKIQRVISIIITDHPLIEESDKFHHHFGLHDLESKVLLTDILEIHTLEIPKARKYFDDTEDTTLLNWMKFLDAKTEEELNVLAQKSPVMQKATLRLLELSADEKARQLYEARLKEQSDYNTRERGAIIKIAKNFLSMGMSINDVSTGTGLSYEDVERLQNADL